MPFVFVVLLRGPGGCGLLYLRQPLHVDGVLVAVSLMMVVLGFAFFLRQYLHVISIVGPLLFMNFQGRVGPLFLKIWPVFA